MNPFFNPWFLGRIIKAYVHDMNRLRNLNDDQLKRYQSKQLRNLVRIAYTVPVYHDKYKKKGVHPSDITSIDDLQKLPTISKQDIKEYSPDGLLPKNANRSRYVEVATSGTTGKSLSLYVDMFAIIMGLFGYLRTVREHEINWRKSRLTIIGDFATHTAESGYINRGLQRHLNLQSMFKNVQWLNTNDDPKKLITVINDFKPDFIGGYVGMLGHLALLREQGYGGNIQPQVIAATGAILDPMVKKLIEQTFQTTVFEVYGATETGPIAFECTHGSYHILSDLVFLEFLRNDSQAPTGEPGKVVVTKLYGGGTPIIRYDAMNDIVASQPGGCDCGLVGGRIKKIYGRDDLSLVLPNGRLMLPSSISEIYSRVLYGLKTTKMKDTQIIQHSLNRLEIQVVIDEDQRNKGPSVESILSTIKHGFQEKLGSTTDITVTEVPSIQREGARIISMVPRDTHSIYEYI